MEGNYASKGCYTYDSGWYSCGAFFGTGGTEAQQRKMDVGGGKTRFGCPTAPLPPPPPPAPSCATQSDCAGIDTSDYQCKDSFCVAPTASVTTFISHVGVDGTDNSLFVTITGSSGVSEETLITAQAHRQKDYTAVVNMAGVGAFVSMEIRKEGADQAIVLEYKCEYAEAVYSWPDQRSHCSAVVANMSPLTEADCQAAALAAGLSLGGGGYNFVDNYGTKGCYTYASGSYAGMAFFGDSGSVAQMQAVPSLPQTRYLGMNDCTGASRTHL
jgi:hypothetical protein